MNHPLRNFQRGPTWSSNNDPLVASNRIMDDLQFLPGIRMKSIVDRDSGTIGILECCSKLGGVPARPSNSRKAEQAGWFQSSCLQGFAGEPPRLRHASVASRHFLMAQPPLLTQEGNRRALQFIHTFL